MSWTHRWVVLGGLLGSVQGLAAPTSLPVPCGGERWYEVRLGTATVGYLHEQVARSDDGVVRTVADSLLMVRRLGAEVEVAAQTESTEDADGHLIHLHSALRASRDTTGVDVVVEGGALRISNEAGGQHYERVEPVDPPLLGPQGVRALTLAGALTPARPIDYPSFLPELGAVVQVHRQIQTGPTGTLEVEETSSSLPTSTRLTLDRAGCLIGSREASPLGLLEVRPASAGILDAVAMAAPLGPDVFAASQVRANLRLPRPREIDRLTVRITRRRSDPDWPELEGPGQRVLERTADHLLLALERPVAAHDRLDTPVTGDPALAPNVFLQSDHPQVRALAESLRVVGAGPLAQALVLRDWVSTHVVFDAGLAVVPASEVVRDRRGTCVAYAILVSSLARALAIPSHVVMGYAYVSNLWAGHAWSEILVDGHWLPVDAALASPTSADAARIAVVRHSMDRGPGSGTLELLRLLGNADIRIDAYGRDGEVTRVPADAAPYTITATHYRNPWLGLELPVPAGFRLLTADDSYPDTTVVRFADALGNTLRLRQTQGGPGPMANAARSALEAAGYAADLGTSRVAARMAAHGGGGRGEALAFTDGTDVWVVEAEGPKAAATLAAVAGRLRLDAHGLSAPQP